MKSYTFEIIINEGCDEFWEETTAGGKSGCDDVQMLLFDTLNQNIDIELADIKLVGYKDK